MKNFAYIALVIVFVLSCNTQKAVVADNSKPSKGDTIRIENDSLEYSVIIIEPGFDGWLASYAYPRKYYSQSYLEARNRQWVTEWNIRAMQPQQYRDLYGMTIDYSPNIDYGYEVNYLLYNYLVFFQNKYHQQLFGRVPDR